jgi:predicted RNase H-like HicB family nuclease
VVEVTIYTAVCRRSGDWWAISVPEIKGLHTQVRRLDQAEDMARDAIALMLDVARDTFDVEVSPELPARVEDALAARREAREAEERADAATGAAAHQLLEDGYTVRDAGRMLGLSPQRISQIATRGSRATQKAKSVRTAVTRVRRKRRSPA